MALDSHTITTLTGADQWAFSDRVHMAKVTLPYAAGSGAGASVTVAVPASVMIPGAGIFVGALPAGVSASINGLNVTLTPASGNTLAAGSATILVIG